MAAFSSEYEEITNKWTNEKLLNLEKEINYFNSIGNDLKNILTKKTKTEIVY